jgi:hypothetical protein
MASTIELDQAIQPDLTLLLQFDHFERFTQQRVQRIGLLFLMVTVR